MWDGLERFTSEWALHAGASSHIFFPLCMCVCVFECVCPPICVGLAGGQSDKGLEKLGVSLYTIVLPHRYIAKQDTEGLSLIWQRWMKIGRKHRCKKKIKKFKSKKEERKKKTWGGTMCSLDAHRTMVSVVSDHWLKSFMFSYPQHCGGHAHLSRALPQPSRPLFLLPRAVHPPALSLLSVSISEVMGRQPLL